MRLLGRLPARLTAEQAAWVINCQSHDIPTLVNARLLKPLGNPTPCGVKYFAASELLALADDRTWLAKTTNAINLHWQRRNAAKKICPANGSNNGHFMAIGDGKNGLDNSPTADR